MSIRKVMTSSVMEYSPVKSPDDSSCEGLTADWTQQLGAYTHWINSQLKKKADTRLVEDFAHDLRDGVALLDLIEIIATERVPGAHDCPSNQTEMKENVDRVLQYMSSHRIKMHAISTKDIVEGNVKATMRLVLALAAHYKPHSVKHSSYRSPTPSHNITSIAQGAAAALTSARRDAAKAGRRSRLSDINTTDPRLCASGSDQPSDSDASIVITRDAHHTPYIHDCCASRLTPSYRVSGPPRPSPATTPKSHKSGGASGVSRSKSIDQMPTDITNSGMEKRWHDVVPRSMYEELLQECHSLWEDIKDTKSRLLVLQDLLLSGQPPDGQETEDDNVFDGNTADEVVILRSKLQYTDLTCTDLRDELAKTREECMQLHGTKSGLQNRLSEQDGILLQTKADLLRKGFELQGAQTEREDMQKLLKEKEKLISNLKAELMQRDRKIDQLQEDLRRICDEKNAVTKNLKSQVEDLNQRLRAVGETEANLSARVASQDKMMAKLQGKIIKSQIRQQDPCNGQRIALNYGSGDTDELQVVTDSLLSLRCHLEPSDPRNHTIDTLEQTITTLIEKLQTANQNADSKAGQSVAYDNVTRRLVFDSTVMEHKPMPPRPTSPDGQMAGQAAGQTDRNALTKLVYYTDDTPTPSMCLLPKRLRDVKLRDIKKIHNKSGLFRYHFKALDPEFGAVKEEVVHDDATVPGWEGKIVAWIEVDQR